LLLSALRATGKGKGWKKRTLEAPRRRGEHCEKDGGVKGKEKGLTKFYFIP